MGHVRFLLCVAHVGQGHQQALLINRIDLMAWGWAVRRGAGEGVHTRFM